MCNFNTLDDSAKQAYHDQLIVYADAFGGKNFFLQFLEAIRKTKPHPLSAKNCLFHFPQGKVSWNKVIFQDKISLLMKVRVNESEQGNLLPDPESKTYKNVLNLVRTLNPIVFTIKLKEMEEGSELTLHPFEIIDDKTTRLDPVFDAIFFCAIETVKKVLNYEPKTA